MNKSKGNMYGWVTHTWNPLNGECSHKCRYCYVNSMKRMDAIKERYSGPPRLNEKILNENLGINNFIFVCNMTDIFAEDVPGEHIIAIINQMEKYDKNHYLIQTKNPWRAIQYIEPKDNYVLATTIECDLYPEYDISNAPSPKDRALDIKHWDGRRTVTVEPILKCRFPKHLVDMIEYIHPEWVSIGADSGNNNLPEPSAEEVRFIVMELEARKIKVILKDNLKRIWWPGE